MRSSHSRFAAVALAASALLSSGFIAPAAAQTVGNVNLSSTVNALCFYSGTPTASGLSNAVFSQSGATTANLVLTLIDANGDALDWGGSITFTGYCNGVGSDVTATSVNGGLRTPVNLTTVAGAPASFDARAAYTFTLATPTTAAPAAGTATGNPDNGTLGPTGSAATANNVGPFTGGVTVVFDGQPAQDLVAGAYSDTLTVTLTAQT